MEKVTVRYTINGEKKEMNIDPNMSLVDFIREELHLTGTKKGCGIGECGVCTVLLNGEPVNSCLVLAPQVDGAEIVTIEGISKHGKLSKLQKAFVEHSAIQCGYCTPGMIMATKALIDKNPEATEDQIRQHLSNNLCRCTGYDQPVKAVLKAAKEIREDNNA